MATRLIDRRRRSRGGREREDMAGRTPRHGSSTNNGAKGHCLLFHTIYILAAMILVRAKLPQTTAFVARRGGQSLQRSLKSDDDTHYNSAAAAVANLMLSTTNKSTKSIFGFGRSSGILSNNPTRSGTPSWLLSATSADSEAKSSQVEDEDEWRTVIAAFQMYKAAYGDLKVPSRFVVPGMAPWPGTCEITLYITFEHFLLHHCMLSAVE